jgi:hypothetical protein
VRSKSRTEPRLGTLRGIVASVHGASRSRTLRLVVVALVVASALAGGIAVAKTEFFIRGAQLTKQSDGSWTGSGKLDGTTGRVTITGKVELSERRGTSSGGAGSRGHGELRILREPGPDPATRHPAVGRWRQDHQDQQPRAEVPGPAHQSLRTHEEERSGAREDQHPLLHAQSAVPCDSVLSLRSRLTARPDRESAVHVLARWLR